MLDGPKQRFMRAILCVSWIRAASSGQCNQAITVGLDEFPALVEIRSDCHRITQLEEPPTSVDAQDASSTTNGSFAPCAAHRAASNGEGNRRARSLGRKTTCRPLLGKGSQ